jgi:hypothetical protein
MDRKFNVFLAALTFFIALFAILYCGRGHADQRITGISRTDVLGYTHTEYQGGKYRTKCISYRDALKYVHTDCRQEDK